MADRRPGERGLRSPGTGHAGSASGVRRGAGPEIGGPEAVGVLFERTVQGFGEMFRQLSFAEIKGSAMQSRALAGLANRTLICCLPGSTGACQLGWEQLIRDQLDARTRPCNFVSHL